jgi:Na+-driven multidrug efflux pump
VSRRAIGVATASTQFFRAVGAMAGVAVMGSIVTSRLGGRGTSGVDPAKLAAALHPVFLISIGLVAVAFVAVLFVPHIELRQTMEERVQQPELLEEAA